MPLFCCVTDRHYALLPQQFLGTATASLAPDFIGAQQVGVGPWALFVANFVQDIGRILLNENKFK